MVALGVGPPISAFARTSTILNPETERIMLLELSDHTPITEDFVIFPSPSIQWFLPLGELSEKLGIAIEVSPNLGMAKGFILREDRAFELNVQNCQVTYDHKTEMIDCSEAVVFNDDIYVKLQVIQRWLPVNITVDSASSRVTIEPREALPFQERDERLRRAAALKNKGVIDHGFPVLRERDSFIDGFLLNEQLSYISNPSLLSNNTQVAGQLLGADAYMTIATNTSLFGSSTASTSTVGVGSPTVGTGSPSTILEGSPVPQVNSGSNLFRFSLSRKDPDGSLFGPIHLSEFDFVDFNLPQLELISLGRQARGMFLSSFPLKAPSTYTQQDFQGNLPVGWQVELYRNDVLLAQQSSNDTGRYVFNNIPLIYGLNRFRLSFYGPQGQRRDEYQTFTVDPSMIQPGMQNYRFALFQDYAEHSGYMAQYETSFLKGLSTTIGAERVAVNPEDIISPNLNYGYLRVTGFLDRFLLNGIGSYNEMGKYAYQLSSKSPLSQSSSLTLSYTGLNDYQSQVYNYNLYDGSTSAYLDGRIQANINFIIPTAPSISNTFQYRRDQFSDGTQSNTLVDQLFTTYKNLSIFHTAQYNFNGPDLYLPAATDNPYNGKLSFKYPVLGGSLGFDFQYDLQGVVGLQEQAQFALGTNSPFVANVGAQQVFIYNDYIETLGMICDLKFMKISTTLLIQDPISISTFLTFSLSGGNGGDYWHMSSQPIATNGAAIVKTFVDLNGNGKPDVGEPPVAHVAVSRDEGQELGSTTDKGVLFVTRLLPYQPVDIMASDESSGDPFLRSRVKGYRLYPRPGKIYTLLFPMEHQGTVEGTASFMDSKYPTKDAIGKRGILIEVLDPQNNVVASMKTESGGFFSLADIAPGDYTVRVSPKQLADLGLKVKPLTQKLSIPSEGSIESGFDFLLIK